MKALRCPVCKAPLLFQGRSLVCKKGHCFDMAKSGYVNLLTPNRMHAALPGDNRQMLHARADFLDSGWYRPLAQALCTAAQRHAPDAATVLDVGCGEGYYTALLADSYLSHGKQPEIIGVDISKAAVNLAAKRTKGAFFIAASAFHLPVADAVCDVACNLFAPFCRQELVRVLKPGGLLFLTVPDRRHLFELKAAVYDTPYENGVKDAAVEGLTLLERIPVEYAMPLAKREDIQNLFAMTPYFYRTRSEDRAKLEKLDALQVTAQFILFIYRKP